MAGTTQAALIVNPPQPITHRVTVQPIIVSNDDGSNTAEFFGTAMQQSNIEGLIDTIWSQAGIDVGWLSPNVWNDTFANVGNPDEDGPRPNDDLGEVVSDGAAAGVTHDDPDVINAFFVEIAAGFSETGENSANGLAFVGDNGITIHIGDNLPGFGGGQEVAASVMAHELGHNLGLPHLVEAENLMQEAGADDPGERLNNMQIATALASPFSIPIPEPCTMALALLGLLTWLPRCHRAARRSRGSCEEA